METFAEFGFQIGVFVILIVIGLVAGTIAERRHVKSLDERTRAFSDMLVTNSKTYPGGAATQPPPTIIIAECVIATDYLKTFLASLRNIFGGEVGSYQSLLIRARREALMRMLEKARSRGYDALCNVRMETADIGGSASARQGAAMAALLAQATAYRRAHREPPTA